MAARRRASLGQGSVDNTVADIESIARVEADGTGTHRCALVSEQGARGHGCRVDGENRIG